MKKKKVILGVLFLLVLIIVVVLIGRPRDYTVRYKRDGFEIEERYDKELDVYTFSVSINDKEFNFLANKKRVKGKKLITGVNVLSTQEEDKFCVLLASSKVESYPVCYSDDEYLDYDLFDEKSDDFYSRKTLESKDDEFNGITFKIKKEQNLFIWNYKGYYQISDAKKEEIKFLERDAYQNNLAYSDGKYILTPNYDQDYSFNKVYLIDMKTGKVIDWELDKEISYNSYFLGDRDGMIYLVDRKNKAEYTLNPKKRKIERVDNAGMGKIWDAKWAEVSMTKLINEDYIFEEENAYKYFLEDGNLMLGFDNSMETEHLSNKNVDKIITIKDDTVFYLVGDTVYSYSLERGENVLLKYGELKFNNLNSVFIY